MTFAHDLSVAIRKSSKQLKKGSRKESVVFLQKAGILTASGELKSHFKPTSQKSLKTRTKVKA